MTLDEAAFHDLANEIAALNGIPLDLALRYVELIGDTPELVSAEAPDLVIVRDDAGAEIARIQFPSE